MQYEEHSVLMNLHPKTMSETFGIEQKIEHELRFHFI